MWLGACTSARLGDEDETLQGEQDKFPKTNVFKSIEVADGRVWMLPEGIEYFAGDLTEEEKQVVWATANPPAATLFSAQSHPWPGGKSRAGALWPRTTRASTLISRGPPPSV